MPRPSKEDIEWATKIYGDKTINRLRYEAGFKPVIGGGIAYIAWLLFLRGEK